MRRKRKIFFAELAMQGWRQIRFLIFTKQSTNVVPGAEMFSRKTQSSALRAEKNKIRKERRFDYEKTFITLACVYNAYNAFAASGIGGRRNDRNAAAGFGRILSFGQRGGFILVFVLCKRQNRADDRGKRAPYGGYRLKPRRFVCL